MIEIVDLKKSYANTHVLKGINISLESGKIYGFLGMNGTGKSTTMNIMSGFLKASSGDVIIDGISMNKNPYQAKKLIGYLPENPPLYNELTVYEYLSFIAQAKGVKKSDVKSEVLSKISLTSCENIKDTLIQNLSKGYRQRVGICGALIADPKYLLLDEPTAGLDPTQIIEIRELLLSLKKDRTIIFSSHILSEISEVCDNILILSQGKIISYDEQNDKHSYIFEIKTDKSIDKFDTFAELPILLETAGDIKKYRIESYKDVREDIFDYCVKNDIKLIGLYSEKSSLEKVFISTLSQRSVSEENGNAIDL